MGKPLAILALIVVEFLILAVYLTVLLNKEFKENTLGNAQSKTATIAISYVAVVFTNGVIYYVILYLTDSRRWYDFALVLIAVFETLAGIIVALLTIAALWVEVSSESWDMNKFYRTFDSIEPLSVGAYVFANNFPFVILSLQVYHLACSPQGELSTRAILTPVVFTTLLAFGTCYLLSNFKLEKGSEWIAIFVFVISYALPAVMSLILIVTIKRYTRETDEETVEDARVFKIFTALSTSFIVFFGPSYIGKMVYVHGGVDFYFKFDYQTFYVISSGFILMKTLLNLPMLMAVDDHFHRGYSKLIRRCWPRKISFPRQRNDGKSFSVRYTECGDTEALLQQPHGSY